jgi:hypothetical protein
MTLEPDGPYQDVCVIAQQYSSATLVSWRFHSLKEKFSARFEKFIILIYVYVFLKTL